MIRRTLSSPSSSSFAAGGPAAVAQSSLSQQSSSKRSPNSSPRSGGYSSISSPSSSSKLPSSSLSSIPPSAMIIPSSRPRSLWNALLTSFLFVIGGQFYYYQFHVLDVDWGYESRMTTVSPYNYIQDHISSPTVRSAPPDGNDNVRQAVRPKEIGIRTRTDATTGATATTGAADDVTVSATITSSKRSHSTSKSHTASTDRSPDNKGVVGSDSSKTKLNSNSLRRAISATITLGRPTSASIADDIDDLDPTMSSTDDHGNGYYSLPASLLEHAVTELSTPLSSSTSSSSSSYRTLSFRNCTSPERNIPWPFLKGTTNDASITPATVVGSSIFSPSLTCDIQTSDSDFATYFRTVLLPQQIQPILDDKKYNDRACRDLVVFSVAFGNSQEFLTDMYRSTTPPVPTMAAGSGIGNTTVGGTGVVNSTALLEIHQHCFFWFTLDDDDFWDAINYNITGTSTEMGISEMSRPNVVGYSSSTSKSENKGPILLGHNWLIPIPPHVLPYTSNRRNAKLFKYIGQQAFTHTARTIMWQDAKFFRLGFDTFIPTNYTDVLVQQRTQTADGNLPCVTTMGIPVHPSSFSHLKRDPAFLRGRIGTISYRPQFEDHCKTILEALEVRPNVTDSPTSILHQCQSYMKHVVSSTVTMSTLASSTAAESNSESNITSYTDEAATGTGTAPSDTTMQRATEQVRLLNSGLIDSAFMIWSNDNNVCHSFNAQLQCSMLDQLACHSDRDQVVFPFVLYEQLRMRSMYEGNDGMTPVSPLSSSSSTKTTRKEDGETIDNHHERFMGVYRPSANISEAKSNNLDRRIPFDDQWNPQRHDLDWVMKTTPTTGKHVSDVSTLQDQSVTIVRIIRSSCHWYYKTTPFGQGDCDHFIWLPSTAQWKHTINRTINEGNRRAEKSNTEPLVVASPDLQADVLRTLQWAASHPHEYGNCTSPERDVRWPFVGGGASSFSWPIGDHSSHERSTVRTCGTKSNSKFHKYLRETVLKIQVQPIVDYHNCSTLAVYGVALEYNNDWLIENVNPAQHPSYSGMRKTLLDAHGQCFFIFADKKQMGGLLHHKNAYSNQPVLYGHSWIVPIDMEKLPYKSARRNTLMMKYKGPAFFPTVRTLIWQDVDFLAGHKAFSAHPLNYYDFVNDVSRDACVKAVGTPPSVFGKSRLAPNDHMYIEHFKDTLRRSLVQLPVDFGAKPSDTAADSAVSLILQSDSYIQHVFQNQLNIEYLDVGMVDTSFLVWNEGTKSCKHFNSELRCSILDQVHCHSEDDQIVFPFALHHMGLATEYYHKRIRTPIDENFKQRYHDASFVIPHDDNVKQNNNGSRQDRVTIIRSNCHWNFKRLGEKCPPFYANHKKQSSQHHTLPKPIL